VLGGWLIRIPHTKIDNVLTSRSRFPLQLIRNAEDVGRQTFNSRKIVHHNVFFLKSIHKKAGPAPECRPGTRSGI
jgi:hypothetical protein